MTKNRKWWLAISLCAVVLFAWQYFVATPAMKAEQTRQSNPAPTAVLPGGANPGMTRDAALNAGGQRVAIDTPMVDGSILLKGARFDDLRLKTYRDIIDPKSPEIVLLAPKHTKFPYSATFGWVGASGMPVDDSQWTQLNVGTLSPGHPVTLAWANGQGLVFTRTVAIDDQYMFTVSDSVANRGEAAVILYPYGAVERQGIHQNEASLYLHVGFVGVANGGEVDANYKDFNAPGTPPKTFSSTSGWTGITDKYWMTAVVPPQNEAFAGAFVGTKTLAGVDAYQANYRLNARMIAPGETAVVTHRLFAGPKEADIMRGYQDKLGISHFDSAVDWGWFWFLTRPIYWLLHALYNLLGDFGLAIALSALLFKAATAPIANRLFHSMSKVKRLEPEIATILQRHSEDRGQAEAALAELYRLNGVTALLAGLLLFLVLIPVYFSLLRVFSITTDGWHASFFGLISDISAPDQSLIPGLFGIWPLTLGLTTWVLQRKISSALFSPFQKILFLALPVLVTFGTRGYPTSWVIFLTLYNALSIAHEQILLRKSSVSIGDLRAEWVRSMPSAKFQPVIFLVLMAPATIGISVIVLYFLSLRGRSNSLKPQNGNHVTLVCAAVNGNESDLMSG